MLIVYSCQFKCNERNIPIVYYSLLYVKWPSVFSGKKNPISIEIKAFILKAYSEIVLSGES